MRSRNPAENRIFTGLRLPPKLLARLDDYCQKQKIHPHRTRVIEVAIAEFLERENPQSPSASESLESCSVCPRVPVAPRKD